MDHILVVNVNWIGDVIFSTPVYKALKAQYPEARITALANPRVVPVLQMCPFVHDIIELKGNVFSLMAQLRKGRFDSVFFLHRSFTRMVLAFLAGIPIRVGYADKDPGFLLTHKAKPIKEEELHRSDVYLNVIESFGIPVEDRRYELIVDEKAILPDEPKNKEFIAVNTGGNWDLKQWPVDSFVALIDHLKERYDYEIVVPGAPKDLPRVQEMQRLCKSSFINLVGQTDLKGLAYLFKQAKCVISNDSGPLHVANAVGTKVVGIFGPTRSENTGPRGMNEAFILHKDVMCNKAPCYHLSCPNNICMKAIEVHDVIQAVEQICA